MAPEDSSLSFDDSALPPEPSQLGDTYGGPNYGASPAAGPGAGPRHAAAGSPRSGGFGGSARGGNSGQYQHEDQLLDFSRTMPQNVEAEQAVLGAMMMNKEAIGEVTQILRSEDFYRPTHASVFDAAVSLYGEGKDVDPILLAGRLERDGHLVQVGGAPYLHTLMSRTPTSANVRYHAQLVREKAVLRRLVLAGTKIVQLGYEGQDGGDVDYVVDAAQQEMFALTNEASSSDYQVFRDLTASTMAELEDLAGGNEEALGIPTGFSDLDSLTNGLRGGQMVIVAARPGVGKSTLALDFMRSASIQHNKPSALFSLEMSQSEVMMRLLSAEAEVRLSNMRGGKMTTDDWDRLTQTLGEIEQAPIFIDDSPNLTMMEIRAKARRLSQQHGLGLVVVDYLQLMSSGKKVESRQQEVSEFSRQLKLLAKEINVPVVAISQLNRAVENRGEDALPRVSDLRESGSLEQDADMVMLLHRPDSQNPDHARAGEADIILAKHRGGPIGTVTVAARLAYSKFSEYQMPH